MATIGFVHIGLHGHLVPASRLSAVLSGLGHRVIAWAPERFREEVEGSGGELRATPEFATRRPMSDPDAVTAGIARATAALCEGTIQDLADADVELVVYDSMAPWGRVAATWLGLPRICSFAGYPAPAVASQRRVEAPSAEHVEAMRQSRDAIVRTWGVEIGGFGDMLGNAGDVTVVYTTPEVAGLELADPSWRMVGPLLAFPVADDEPALDPDDGRPLVYLALGTLFSHRTALFRAPLEALADEDVRVLVATGGAEVERIGPLPPNAKAVRRVRSRVVLSRAKVHITHGGAGSVHESLAAGVPMVCLPQGSDHFHWAKRIGELGAGDVVEEPDPGAIRAAVLRLLADDELRRRTNEIADHLRSYPGPAMVGDAVDALLN